MEDDQLMVDHVGGNGRKTSRFTNNCSSYVQTLTAEQVALQLFQLPIQPFQFAACLI